MKQDNSNELKIDRRQVSKWTVLITQIPRAQAINSKRVKTRRSWKMKVDGPERCEGPYRDDSVMTRDLKSRQKF